MSFARGIFREANGEDLDGVAADRAHRDRACLWIKSQTLTSCRKIADLRGPRRASEGLRTASGLPASTAAR